jgi:hypothetical protein
MSGVVFFMIVIFAFATLGAFALAFGVDSRDGFEDDRAPARGLTW